MAQRPKQGLLLGMVFLVTVLSVLFVGCGGSGGGGGGGSPSDVVKAFYSAVDKGDFETASSYISPGMPSDFENSYISGWVGNIKEVEILNETETSDTSAVVEAYAHFGTPVVIIATMTCTEEREQFFLDNVQGIWKIKYIYPISRQ
jgi:hypothetical protein